jgi:hypothetical protein
VQLGSVCLVMNNVKYGLFGCAATLVASTTKDASAATRGITIVEEQEGEVRKEGKIT